MRLSKVIGVLSFFVMTAMLFVVPVLSQDKPVDKPVDKSVAKSNVKNADKSVENVGQKPTEKVADNSPAETEFDAPKFLKQLKPTASMLEKKIEQIKKAYDKAKAEPLKKKLAFEGMNEQRKVRVIQQTALLALAYYYCKLAGISQPFAPVIQRHCELGTKNIAILDELKKNWENQKEIDRLNTEFENNRNEQYAMLISIKRAIIEMKDDHVVLDEKEKEIDYIDCPNSPHKEFIKWGGHNKKVGKTLADKYRSIEEYAHINLLFILRDYSRMMKFSEPPAVQIGNPYPPKWPEGIPTKEQLEGAKKAGFEPVIELDLGKGVFIKMVYIPPGEFMMGGEGGVNWLTGANATPIHNVIFTKGFYMSVTEITQAQWCALMDKNPSTSKMACHLVGTSDTSNFPVENITKMDAQEFNKKLNAMFKTDSFRLPSEAEWEYACRAGTKTKYYFGDNDRLLKEYENYADINYIISNILYSDDDGDDGYEFMAPVGQFKPNPWGLYDILGNIYEICEDAPHDNYRDAPNDGRPWVETNNGTNLSVARGADYGLVLERHKYFVRYIGSEPTTSAVNGFMTWTGFRIVKTLDPPKKKEK